MNPEFRSDTSFNSEIAKTYAKKATTMYTFLKKASAISIIKDDFGYGVSQVILTRALALVTEVFKDSV